MIDDLFRRYVEEYINIYGEHSITSNVHNVCHVAHDVRRFGILSTFDAYPFENCLRVLKLKLSSCKKPLEQISRRISEIQETIHSSDNIQSYKNPNIHVPILKFPVRSSYDNRSTVFQTIMLKNFRLSSKKFGDKWFQRKDGKIVEFQYAMKRSGDIFVCGKEIVGTDNFFTVPLLSSDMDIYVWNGEKGNETACSLNDIKCKIICLSYKDRFVLQPMLHSLK